VGASLCFPYPPCLRFEREQRLSTLVAMEYGPDAAGEDYCYLTTRGRVSGEPREIEIWFALIPPGTGPRHSGRGPTLFMLSGGQDRSNWVRNLLGDPAVTVRIGDVTRPGRARVVEDPAEDERARSLLFEKYSARYGGDLGNWRRTALPIAVDFTE
jgi:deazaflavin-dependent oxidoreductase (nitroreductase family)